jgi:hypothetical protein
LGDDADQKIYDAALTPFRIKGFPNSAPLDKDSFGEGLLPEEEVVVKSSPSPKSTPTKSTAPETESKPSSVSTSPESTTPEVEVAPVPKSVTLPESSEAESPKSPESVSAEKTRVVDPRMAPEEDKSLRGRIDSANRASEKAVDFDELGREKGWFRSAFNKLSIKMGWSKDIVNQVRLSTVNKLGMGNDNFWNNRLINKKRREVSVLDRKISRENGNTKADRLAKENIERINKSIDEAVNSKDSNLVKILNDRRNEMIERGTSKKDQLETERNSLNSQLERYKDRKVAILDNFVASVEMQTEKVRRQEGYHENVKKRATVNIELERMLDVMAQTESEVITLKKALAITKDSEERYVIKESIREYKEQIKESKRKSKKYEKISHRLGSFIDLTDKRTKRFDDLQNRYLNRRDNVIDRNKVAKTEAVPPPSPKEKPKEEKTPTPTTPTEKEKVVVPEVVGGENLEKLKLKEEANKMYRLAKELALTIKDRNTLTAKFIPKALMDLSLSITKMLKIDGGEVFKKEDAEIKKIITEMGKDKTGAVSGSNYDAIEKLQKEIIKKL